MLVPQKLKHGSRRSDCGVGHEGFEPLLSSLFRTILKIKTVEIDGTARRR